MRHPNARRYDYYVDSQQKYPSAFHALRALYPHMHPDTAKVQARRVYDRLLKSETEEGVEIRFFNEPHQIRRSLRYE